MKRLLQAAVVAAISLPLFAQTPAVQTPAPAPAPAVAPKPAAPAPAPAPAVVAKPVATAPASAAVPAGETVQPLLRVDAGGDIRIRQEAIGNIPTINPGTHWRPGAAPNYFPGTRGTRGLDDHRDYFRFRTRAWFEVGYENVSLYTRVANEWREYNNYTPAMRQVVPKNPWKSPDELVLDNLYLNVKGLFNDRLDLRIGRQDLIYGAGRVILEGTPGDGSRTLFFDAAKATIHLTSKSSLDAFALYNLPYSRHTTIGALDRDVIGGGPAGSEITEKGAGLYLTCKELKEVPAELYYVFKRATLNKDRGSHDLDFTGPNLLPDVVVTAPARVTGRDVHTVGARIMPQLCEQVSAEFEGAVQFGDTDVPQTPGQRFNDFVNGRHEPDKAIHAYMGYAGITYKPDFGIEGKPFFRAACYYLSGDENGTPGNDNRWDPVFARYPQFSELMVFAYPAGRYSNLVYPHLETGIICPCKHNLTVKVGPMYAAVEDRLALDSWGNANGNDAHSYMGMLATARYDFPLLTGVFGKRGDVFGHVQAEVFAPGDYYASDDMAYFLRWEITAKF